MLAIRMIASGKDDSDGQNDKQVDEESEKDVSLS